jgi:hypothetical protein
MTSKRPKISNLKTLRHYTKYYYDSHKDIYRIIRTLYYQYLFSELS